MIRQFTNRNTTTDLLNYASELVQDTAKSTSFAEYAVLREEARGLTKLIEGQLESGAHQGQARHELLCGKHLATAGVYEARKLQFESKGWR